MPDFVAIDWDKAAMNAFTAALRRTVDVCGKAAADTVGYGFVQFCKSARNSTRRGKLFRDVIRNPNYRKRKKRARSAADENLTAKVIAARKARAGKPEDPTAHFPFLVRYLYQRRAPRLVGAMKRSTPLKRISRRGTAIWSWGRMMKLAFPQRGQAAKNPPGVPLNVVHVLNNAMPSNRDPSVEFTNFLVYLLKVHPTIGAIAMNNAAKRMEYMADQRIANDMKRVWKS